MKTKPSFAHQVRFTQMTTQIQKKNTNSVENHTEVSAEVLLYFT